MRLKTLEFCAFAGLLYGVALLCVGLTEARPVAASSRETNGCAHIHPEGFRRQGCPVDGFQRESGPAQLLGNYFANTVTQSACGTK